MRKHASSRIASGAPGASRSTVAEAAEPSIAARASDSSAAPATCSLRKAIAAANSVVDSEGQGVRTAIADSLPRAWKAPG